VITFALISPALGSLQAGDHLISVGASSTAPDGDLKDSLQVRVNGVLLPPAVGAAPGAANVTETLLIRGPQTVILEAAASDLDGSSAERWTLQIQAESRIPEPLYREAITTDYMAGVFSPQSAVRADRYSTGRQILNPLARKVDEVQKRILDLELSRSPRTVQLDQPSHLYSFKPEDGSLLTSTDAAGAVKYMAPMAKGVHAHDKIPLTQVESLKALLSALPTRYDATPHAMRENSLLPVLGSSDGGYMDVELERETEIFLTVWNAAHLVALAPNRAEYEFSTLLVEGEDEMGDRWQTNLVLMQNGTARLPIVLKKITRVSLEAAADESYCQLYFTQMKPRMVELEDKTRVATIRGQARALTIEAGVDDVGSYMERSYQTETAEVASITGRAGKQTFDRYALVDSSGAAVTISDFDVEANGWLLYAVDNSRLFVYDRRPPLHLGLKARVREELIEMAFEVLISAQPYRTGVAGEKIASVELDLVPLRKTKVLKRWAWSLKNHTTGKRYILTGGTEPIESAGGESWRVKPEKQPRYELPQQNEKFDVYEDGDYTAILKAEYGDGTKEESQKLFSIRSASPVAEYDLSTLIDGVGPYGVNLDANGRVVLWGRGRRVILKPRYDLFAFDEDEGEVITRDRFDAVEITTNV